MGRIRKLISLPAGQRWLLFKAAALIGVVRVTLWLLRFPHARVLIEWASQGTRRLAGDPLSVDELAWTVGIASRFIPGGEHCMSKAVAASIILRRRGHSAEIRYGGMRDTTKGLIAHAWLESEGRVLIGGENLNCYAMLRPRPNTPE